MNDPQPSTSARRPFYTVSEAAELLRVNAMTIYRAIREDGFPAVRVRSRYVIPAAAIEQMAADATATGGCIDVAAIAAERRITRELERQSASGQRQAGPRQLR